MGIEVSCDAVALGQDIPFGIVFGNRSEQARLLTNLGPVTDQDDLRVRGIKMAARGRKNIAGGELANTLTIGFEVSLGQLVEIDGRKLAQETVLGRDAEGENAGEVAAGAIKFLGGNWKRAHAVHFVEHFRERGGGHVVSHCSADGKITQLSQGVHSATGAVDVALLFADIHDQARMKCAAENRIGEDQAIPVGVAASDGKVPQKHLRLHGAGPVHQMDASARLARRRWRYGSLRLWCLPCTKDFFDLLEHRVREEIPDHDEQGLRRNVMTPVELRELIASESDKLLFGWCHYSVGMCAE